MSQKPPETLKAVLFDMDGVLYDSMKHHADTWVDAFKKYNIDFSAKDAYIHEGRTGDGTIKKAIRKTEGREATPEEIHGIYEEKTRLMNLVPEANIIEGMQDLMTCLRDAGIKIIVVTGSRQPALLDRLKHDFGVERHEVVSGWDVKSGKPDPEPYLIGLEKAGISAEEAIVIENAPLGVESAINAGIYTIAINTGPLEPEYLTKAGSAKVFETAGEIKHYLSELAKS